MAESSHTWLHQRNENVRQGVPVNYNFLKLHVLITNRCNFTCGMCSIIHNGKSTLSESQVRSLIADADELGFDEVEISGGEPYYLPYFKPVIEDYAGKIKPTVKICTNGYSLDRALIDRLAGRKRLHFQVSFDGTGDVHNAIRVQKRYDAFSKSEQNFRALAEAGLSVSLNTVIQRSNVGNILSTYRHFRDVGYLFHGFNFVEDGSWDYDKNRLLPDQIDDLVAELETLVAESKVDGKVVALESNMISHFKEMKASGSVVQDASQFPLHPGYGCTVPFSIAIVHPDGTVVPCFHFSWPNSADFNLGQRRLKDIVFSPEYIERSRRAVQIDGCKGCTTACYFHDPVFRRKCMHPTAFDLALRDAQRDFLRRRPALALWRGSRLHRALRMFAVRWIGSDAYDSLRTQIIRLGNGRRATRQ